MELAKEHGFRRVFENDPDIGGRYSALSYFGLVPAALMGVDVGALLDSAQVAEQACANYDHSASNQGLWLGLSLGELATRGRDKLTLSVAEPIESFGLWAEQLVAESTGKEGRGSCRWRTSRSGRRSPTATIACSAAFATPIARRRTRRTRRRD